MPLEAQTIEVPKRREEMLIDRIGGRDARVYVKAWAGDRVRDQDPADDVGPEPCATTSRPLCQLPLELEFPPLPIWHHAAQQIEKGRAVVPRDACGAAHAAICTVDGVDRGPDQHPVEY